MVTFNFIKRNLQYKIHTLKSWEKKTELEMQIYLSYMVKGQVIFY